MKRLFNKAAFKPTRQALRKNQTEAENRLLQKLRNRQLRGVKFFRQYGVGSYILDFYSPVDRLAIELDGGHHAEEVQAEQDKIRAVFLQSAGITVIRFWNNEVFENIDSVLEEILRYISDSPPNFSPPH